MKRLMKTLISFGSVYHTGNTMKFIFVLSALLAVAAAKGVQKESRAFFTFPLSPAPKPTAATTTTVRTTTKATTTTAKPKSEEAKAPAKKGELPPNAISNVQEMVKMYPQLQGHDAEIFNNEKQLNPDPMMATVDQLPRQLKTLIQTLIEYVRVHPGPYDMKSEITVNLAV